MNIIKTAFLAEWKRNRWLIALVVIINVVYPYWRYGNVTASVVLGTVFGVFLVSVVAVLIQLYGLSRKNRTGAR